MSARVYIHPACTKEPGETRLGETLRAHGYDTTALVVYQDYRGRHELARELSVNVDGSRTLERMDGSRFILGGAGRSA